MSGLLRGMADRLFTSIEAECPSAWMELSERGADLSIDVDVGETFGIRVDRSGPQTCDPVRSAAVQVETDVRTLKALVFGERDIMSALEDDCVLVHGSPADVSRLSDFIHIVVAGAARTRAGEALADELIALATTTRGA